jgi:hypothetical protein
MLNASDLRKPEIRQVVMDTFKNCLETTKVDPSLLIRMPESYYDSDTKMVWFYVNEYVYLNSGTLDYLDSLYPYLDINSHAEKLYSIQDDVLKEIADKYSKILGTPIYYDQNRFGLTELYGGYTSDELITKSLADLFSKYGVNSIIRMFLTYMEKALILKPGTSFSKWYEQGGWKEVAKNYFYNRVHQVYLEFNPMNSIQFDFLKMFFANEVEMRKEIEARILQYLDSCPKDFEQPRKVTKVRPPKFKPVLQKGGEYDPTLTPMWKILTRDADDIVRRYLFLQHLYSSAQLSFEDQLQQYPDKLDKIICQTMEEIVDEFGYDYYLCCSDFYQDTIYYGLEASLQGVGLGHRDVPIDLYTLLNLKQYVYEIDTAIEAVIDRVMLKLSKA